jgi:DNA-binding MarR family transcriptional regulator
VTPEQIREVVKMTLDELTLRKLIKDDYQSILKVVEGKLKNFFNNRGDGISYVLRQLSDDQYIDIIFLQYRDGKTLEWIAEYMAVDVSTVKRNKKRLMYAIYEQLEEA